MVPEVPDAEKFESPYFRHSIMKSLNVPH